ncbi:MAG: hypothetical protein ACRC7N_07360 [Clostridium sp.]
MGVPRNINFYINTESINTLKSSLSDEIEKLTQTYLDLEKRINEIEGNNVWSGKSYDSFKEKFEEWKLEYLQNIVEITMIKQFTEDIVSLGEELIEQRDALYKSLEV